MPPMTFWSSIRRSTQRDCIKHPHPRSSRRENPIPSRGTTTENGLPGYGRCFSRNSSRRPWNTLSQKSLQQRWMESPPKRFIPRFDWAIHWRQTTLTRLRRHWPKWSAATRPCQWIQHHLNSSGSIHSHPGYNSKAQRLPSRFHASEQGYVRWFQANAIHLGLPGIGTSVPMPPCPSIEVRAISSRCKW